MTGPARPTRRFWLALLLILLIGGTIRITYVWAATRHDPLMGDQIYYSALADTLARGDGFRDPFISERVVPSADHPPLTSMVVAPASWLFDPASSRARTGHRLTMAMIGTLTVAVMALTARRVFPRRADTTALIAATLAAVHPGLWINDGLIMSETVGALTVALVIWASFRALDEPTGWRMFQLGLAVGLAVLARAEAALLVPLLVVPIGFTHRGDRDRRPPAAPLRWLAATGAGGLLMLGPWVIPNLVRFNQPTIMSTNDGLTIIGTNCDPAYRGVAKGLWVLSCIEAVDSNGDGVNDWEALQRGLPIAGDDQDASDVSLLYRHEGLGYLTDHLDELPGVMAARFTRVWSLTGVAQTANFYNKGEGRRPWINWGAQIGFWVLAPLAAIGLVILRRNGRPIWPLAVHAVLTSITAAMFYGLWRFRIGAEVAVILAASVALATLLGRWRDSRPATDANPDIEPAESADNLTASPS